MTVKLTAKYDLDFPHPVLVAADRTSGSDPSRPVFDGGRLRFTADVDGFAVELVLSPHDGDWTELQDGTPLVGSYGGQLSVSRTESEPIPDIVVRAGGGKDFTARSPYFQRLAGEYGGVARTCLERFFSFVRFSLGQPLLWSAGDSAPQVIRTTTWLDENGEPIRTGFQAISAEGTGARWRSWGSTPVSAGVEPSIATAIAEPQEVPLSRILIAQGKDAAIQGDLRRAVLELAIGCEVATKQAFFARESAAGEAFEYLEDRNYVRIRALELLGEPARRAFSSAFSDEHPQAHQQVDWLFRCRNKVAHRGELGFRDDSGERHSVDREQVKQWSAAAETLVEWLHQKSV